MMNDTAMICETVRFVSTRNMAERLFSRIITILSDQIWLNLAK
jgi:hypothetical protein